MDNILIIIIGLAFTLLLPGYCFSFTLFKHGTIDGLQRLGLSVAFSAALVPLVAFYLNLIGIVVNQWSLILEIMAIASLSLAYAYYKHMLTWKPRIKR